MFLYLPMQRKQIFFLTLSKYRTLIAMKKMIYRDNIYWKKSLNIKEKAKTGGIKKNKCYFLTIAMTRLMWNLSLTGKRGRAVKSQHTYLVDFIFSVKGSQAECPHSVWTMESFERTLPKKVKEWQSTWSIWQYLPEHNSQHKNADSF